MHEALDDAEDTKTPLGALNLAIELGGGVTALARTLNVAQNRVSNWKARGRVPAEQVVAIETAVGARVTRYQLRPDVFVAGP